MRLAELRAVLADRGIQLTKSLGQNFLHDGQQLRRIISLADLSGDDQVLEVGPGMGALTELLLGEGCRVLAIEKDRRLVDLLRSRFPETEAFELITGDAVSVLRRRRMDWSGWKLVANMPYSVASPILVDFALASHPPERMVVTLQLDVARRLTAEAGRKEYGLLTLLVGARFQVNAMFGIPRQSFFPVPAVESACLRLDRREKSVVSDEALPLYRKVVKCAFSQRRKKMIKLLRNLWPMDSLLQFYAAEGLREDIRAERVTLTQFARLAERLAECETKPGP